MDAMRDNANLDTYRHALMNLIIEREETIQRYDSFLKLYVQPGETNKLVSMAIDVMRTHREREARDLAKDRSRLLEASQTRESVRRN